MRPYLVFVVCMSVATFAACTTQEISPGPFTYVDGQPGPDRGELVIIFAPTADTFEEQQMPAVGSSLARADVFVDGRQVVWIDTNGATQPSRIYESCEADIGYLPAGSHRFTIAAPSRGATYFAGDGEIVPGSTMRLYLFGHLDAMEGRFVSYPMSPPSGTAHVSLTNLVRTGQSVEVVSCADASSCTPRSAPLALGESFAGDFPLDSEQNWPNGRFIVSNGAALGYRQVPTAAAPEPPVEPLSYGAPGSGASPSSATLLAAPVYMSPAGDVQVSF